MAKAEKSKPAPRVHATLEGARNGNSRERYPRLESFALPGPWTEADDTWLECMTGEYDRRIQREAFEREAAGSDL
jgi:hypothetical protein